MQIKFFLKSRGAGFYLTAAVSLISLITAIVYAACYASSTDCSLAACIITAACALWVGLSFTKLDKLAPYLQFMTVLTAFCFYAYSLYYYVSVVLVGIDLDSFSAEFIVCTLLYAVLIIASAVNVFFKQGEKENSNERGAAL